MTRALATLATATAAALAAAGLLAPADLDLAVTLLVYVTIAQAWNILGGYAGQISLGVAAFVGAGGYSTGLLLLHTDAAWPIALAGSGLVAALVALALAPALLRLHGAYFVVGTLVVAVALQAFVLTWDWAGGAIGLTLPFDALPGSAALFRAAVAVCALTLAATLLVRGSRFGLRLMAIRDDEDAAAGLGVSVPAHRLGALVLSSALTGLAGGVLALQLVSFAPDGMFALSWTLAALLAVAIGGGGTFAGPIVGAAVVYYGLTRQLDDLETLSLALEGALLIAIVRLAPRGLWPRISDWLIDAGVARGRRDHRQRAGR